MIALATGKRICILVFSNIARDGRVLREVEYARRDYEVDVIAYGSWDHPENINYFQLERSDSNSFASNMLRLLSLAAGKFNSAIFEDIFWRQAEYKQAMEILKKGRYDLIHANDWNALSVAGFAVRGTKTLILFDAHEYTPAQFNQYFTGRYLKSQYYEYMLRAHSKDISGMITVSDGIAALYRKNFGWDATVVRNAPQYVSVESHSVIPGSIQLVHHGGAIPGRYLEELIQLISLLDERFQLTFILVPTDRAYLIHLKKLSSRLAPDRIKFLDPIAPSSLAAKLAAYDIGVHLLRAANLNHLYALPNKLFDFIMAGLGVAIFPLPEMAKVVKEYQIGIVSPDESIHSMAAMLNNLSASQIDEFKRNSLLLAKTLNGDVEMRKLIDIYAKLLAG
ncbi:MAG TPA: glycosyltransferase [Anaerolineales bacterium]|nr:glycosyltransferase [Anaerolineales bacterium]